MGQIQITQPHLFMCTLKLMLCNDIPVGLLDAVISDGDICKIAAVYLVNWEELSPVLGLNPPAGAAILNSFKDYGTQKREVLRKWKALKGDAATYNALIVAAENISNRQLAHEVRRMEKNPDEGNAT